MLNVIRYPDGWEQKIPTPPQVSSRKSMRLCKEHQYLTASYKNQNPIVAPRSVPDSTASIFVYPSGSPSGSPSDKPTKYTFPVKIISPISVPSETPTKDSSHVPKEFESTKPIKIPIEPSSGYQTGATSTIKTDHPSLNPRSDTITESDSLKRGAQESQVVRKEIKYC